jgi:hypothetical protein
MARFTQGGGSGDGSALNYVQVAGTPQTISTAPNAIVDLNITTTGKPVQISVTGEGANASAGSWLRLNLFRDNVEIGNAIQMESSAASENVPFAINFIDDVEAGTYNYSARVTTITGGNWVFGEADGPVMNAVELTGFKGDTGTAGSNGTNGTNGTNGADGADGADGASAYDIAVENGFDGTEQEWLDSLVGSGGADLVVPTAIKDLDGDDFITFTRTSNNTARIATPQDDLSLRSARDITLFPGSDGVGNVYIGWGDAETTPNATNRVATIADIQSANTGDITFVDNTISSDTGDDIVIENKDDDGIVKARITLDQSNEQVLIEAIASDSEWFNDTQWSTAVWAGSVVTITNTPDIINFFNNVSGDVTRVSINDGGLITYEGASFGSGNMTLNVGGTPVAEEDPLTVTEIRFYYELVSEINIDHDDSEFNIISRGMSMTIDSSGDLELKARDEDLSLYANDDVRFTTNWDNNGTEHSWRMSEIGRFELPGAGYIQNPVNSSGDGGNNDTIKIVPDADLLDDSIFNVDQYIVIDPTGPNHIHIRAGGEIDSSSADLILGGERNQVLVSDTDREVKIGTASQETINTYLNTNTENSTLFITDMSADISYGARVNIDGLDFTVDSITGDTPSAGLMTVSAGGATFTAGQTYTFVFDGNGDNEWTFGTDGYLYGPVNGNLGVASIYGLPNTPLEVDSQHSVVLKGYNGEYLNGISSENQIATIGDVNAGRFGASASYHSRVTQGPQVSANLVQPFTFSSTDWETGIERVDNTKIKMLNAGKYNIAFSAQLVQGNNNGTVNIWLNKNGTPMAYTNTKVTIESNATYTVAAWNFFVDAATDDYYELIWSSTSTHTTIQYDPAQTINGNLHPEIPSIIVTVNQVG